MERPFSLVPGRAALALRNDVLLLRLATQARPPLAGWPLGSRAAGARLVVLDTRRHVIEFPTEPPGRLEITEDESPTGRRDHVDAERDSRDSGLHEYADAARKARTVPAAKKRRRATCTTRSSLASWIRYLSPRAVSRWDTSPAIASEVRGPVVHQAAPPLEEITAGVGRLGGNYFRHCGYSVATTS